MERSRPPDKQEWRNWLERVGAKISCDPSIDELMSQALARVDDPETQLPQLERDIEREVMELDQDAINAELLAGRFCSGPDLASARCVQARLDHMSSALLNLLIQIRRKRPGYPFKS